PVAIVSDNFSSIIRAILRNNGITGLKVHANTIKFPINGLFPVFAGKKRICPRCGNCKNYHLLQYRVKNNIIVYIGDGLSDACPASHSDIVFAKDSLLKKFRKEKRACVTFKDLGDIYRAFTNGEVNEHKTKGRRKKLHVH
ncbi:MAG: hypothetical protein HQL28_06350, partial [Candidatus Omnitrophica bacterium]|nr:hypothetical protein [Candidatus Omnitrophota bacterium]